MRGGPSLLFSLYPLIPRRISLVPLLYYLDSPIVRKPVENPAHSLSAKSSTTAHVRDRKRLTSEFAYYTFYLNNGVLGHLLDVLYAVWVQHHIGRRQHLFFDQQPVGIEDRVNVRVRLISSLLMPLPLSVVY